MTKEELNRIVHIAAWQIKEEIGLSVHSVNRVKEIIAKQFGCLENAPIETVRHTNDWFWGTDVSFITADGKGHIAVSFQANRIFGWIHDLYVHPDARGEGYATQLLALAEAEARERGMTAVRLSVEYKRRSVLDWYLRKGYSDDYDGHIFNDTYTELQKNI